MATVPLPSSALREVARRNAYYFRPFDPLYAPAVARWPRDGQELFWLAPKTLPPLTPAKVVAWTVTDGRPMLFHHDNVAEPIGYLELNPMPGEYGHFWLGHCIIRPEFRSSGQGRLLISLALELAFHELRATRVSLVVFPENMAAIRCYRQVGMMDVGDQYKYFEGTGRRHRMAQMTIDRASYLSKPLPHEFRSTPQDFSAE